MKIDLKVCLAALAAFWLLAGTTSAADKPLRAGDEVVVTAAKTQIKAGSKVLATIDREKRFTITKISEKREWLLATISVDGKDVSGWVRVKDVQRYVQPKPKPAPIKPDTPAPAKPAVKSSGRMLKRDQGKILCIAFSSDGKSLVAAGEDKGFRIWNLTDGTSLDVVEGYEGRIRCLRFSEDGPTLDESGEPEAPRIKWLVTGGGGSKGGELKLWRWREKSEDWKDAKPEVELSTGKNEIASVAFAADSQKLYTSDNSKFVTEWDIPSGENLAEYRTSHGYIAPHVAVSADGQFLVSDSKLGFLYRYELKNISDPQGDGVEAYIPDMLDGHKRPLTSLVFSPGGDALAVADQDRKVIVWNVKEGKILVQLAEQPAAVTGMAYSPNGRILATVSLDNRKSLNLWSTKTGQLLATQPGAPSHGVAFSPDGKTIAAAGKESVHLWKLDELLSEKIAK